MDGTGELFADFIAALHDAVVPLVVSYPKGQVLDYEALTEFARASIPFDRPFVLLGESFSGPVAIALAAFRPPGLRGLILCCSFARNPVPAFFGENIFTWRTLQDFISLSSLGAAGGALFWLIALWRLTP